MKPPNLAAGTEPPPPPKAAGAKPHGPGICDRCHLATTGRALSQREWAVAVHGWERLCDPCHAILHDLTQRLLHAVQKYDEHTLRNLVLVAEAGTLMQ